MRHRHNPRIHKMLIAVRTEATLPFAAVRSAVQKAIAANDSKMKTVSICRVGADAQPIHEPQQLELTEVQE